MIDEFSGPYRYLSNFYPSLVVLDGVEYPTVEHAYQAAKTLDPNERRHILTAATPGRAKRLGRRVHLRPDWEEVKVQVMAKLVWQKFSRHPELRRQLLATGGQRLAEGNSWGDVFWGVCGGRGQNYLGRILMRVRSKLREEGQCSLS